uniref:Variant surface glycoprotein 1125.513 n=1 Tax=Trypanosoma brucei TaxID=5691 RepID=A0A1J0R651_9TRYP|nr:variant surface glycoprotein 1125.513 [Trypanosoma brucei]
MAPPQLQGLIILMALATLKATAEVPDPATACSEACGCKRRLTDRLNLYATDFKETVAQHKTNDLAAAKYTLAALAGHPGLRKALIPVVAAAKELTEACKSAIAAAVPAEVDAQYFGGQITGIYVGLNAISKIQGSFKTATHGSGHVSNDAPTTADLGGAKKLDCDDDKHPDYKPPTLATEAKEADPAKLQMHSKLTAKCVSTLGAGCNSAAIGANGYVEVKLSYSTTPPSKSGTWTTASHTTDHVVGTAALDLMGTNGSDINTKLKNLRENHNLGKCKQDIKSYATVSKVPNWKLYVSKALVPGHTGEKSADPPQLNKAIAEAYGEGGADFSANIWTKVEETLVPVKESDQETLKPISTLSTKAHVYEALARVLLKKQKNEQEDQQKVSKKVDTTKDKECNGKKGDECTGECEWDKEKETCKPKNKGEEENKDKTGTTNTKESNYFVIKKSPLWLAFLLL